MKSLILIFIALGCGLVASIGISQVMDRGGNAGTAVEMEQILVALTDIDAGAKLDATNMQLEDWPRNKIPESALRRLDDANEKYSATRFYKGEPILLTKISDSARGVSQLIPDGYRAEPVKVEEDTVMKAISPGDRVDVSVFLKKDNKEILRTGVFPILRNVQIFAVNSNTDREEDAKGGETAFRTVSLLVKEKQCGELQLAAEMGKIRLSLRRPDESDEASAEDVTKMEELLQGKGELGSDPRPVAPAVTTPSTGGLTDLFPSSQPGSAPPEWQIEILGPNGAEQWQWARRDALPSRATQPGESSGFSPPPASTNTPADASSTGAPTLTAPEDSPAGGPRPSGEQPSE